MELTHASAYTDLAQSVERQALNLVVVSSNLTAVELHDALRVV